MSNPDTTAPETPTTIPHWIDGQPRPGAATRLGDVTNPATGRVTGQVVLADGTDVAAPGAAGAAAGGGGGV